MPRTNYVIVMGHFVQYEQRMRPHFFAEMTILDILVEYNRACEIVDARTAHKEHVHVLFLICFLSENTRLESHLTLLATNWSSCFTMVALFLSLPSLYF